jgi:hypothetical protein
MPSPFPGMDPFLEHPRYFPGLHSSLIFVIYETLQRALPEPYFAVLNERLWVETSERFIEPDVDLMRARGRARRNGGPRGNLALQTRSEPVHIVVAHDERRETYIEIRITGDEGERVVTTIEVLSLSNKRAGEKRRERYLLKQGEVVSSNTNLVEIDLLRGGTHTTAVPLALLKRKTESFDYHVCVYDHDMEYWVYPIRLEESLPEIAVPLLPETAAVPLDLQAVFERAYDAGPYKRRLKYEVSRLVPRLPAKQARWATQRLRNARRTDG